MILFLNNDFIDEAEACIDPADRGFMLADGVFDTLLVEDGAPIDAAAHFARLRRHAAVLDISMPMTDTELIATAGEILRRNTLSAGRYTLRTTLTRGIGARGLTVPDDPAPTLLMRATQAPPVSDKPVRLIIAETTRRNAQSPLSRIKSLGYGDNLLALIEAKRYGVDDAVLLNEAGTVACATTSNIFIRLNGRLLTPPGNDGALDGITRRSLLDSHGAEEETITVGKLQAAEEILLTNSIASIRKARL